VESTAAVAAATGVALAGGSSGRTDGRLHASRKNSSSSTAMSMTVREFDIALSTRLQGEEQYWSVAIVALARHPHKRCWRSWVLRHRVGGMASPLAWFWVRLRGGSRSRRYSVDRMPFDCTQGMLRYTAPLRFAASQDARVLYESQPSSRLGRVLSLSTGALAAFMSACLSHAE